MPRMTNQNALTPPRTKGCHLNVDFGYQWASGIKHLQASTLCLFLNRAGYAMGAKNNDRLVGHFGQLIDKYRTASAQVIDYVTVVNHLVAHIHRPAKHLEGAIDDVDGTIYPGTETSRVGEYDIHQCSSAGSTRAMRTLK
jgi:hypothetical protein